MVNRRSTAPATGASKRAGVRKVRFGTMEVVAFIVVAIIFLLTIAMPLRNYFEQRNEIRQVTASIQQKQQRKEQLIGELDKYRSQAYQQEQARNRLGVIAPGEVAFRIIDPEMQKEDTVTTKKSAENAKPQPWFDTLWGSISAPPAESTTGETPTPAPTMHMPIKPTGAPQPPQVPAGQ